MAKLAILALGAYEQHGKHLPYDTDSLIAEAICTKLKASHCAYDIVFLPIQAIGYSPEHLFDKNSKSLDYKTAIENIINIGKTCHEQSIQKLLIINCHGGNSPIMQIAAQELRLHFKLFCLCTHWLRFGVPQDIITAEERELDIHAGFIETSLMLHIAPHLVKMELAKNFSNKQQLYQREFKYLRAYGKHNFAWLMPDLNKAGCCGNAKKANALAGAEILRFVCQELNILIKEIIEFDLHNLAL